ncbi:MAG: DNA alkylation repair protein [Deltaproteobacteria bacterium]|nr:DNA alkylation repair protein [Deltaproteobacteria bacterium]
MRDKASKYPLRAHSVTSQKAYEAGIVALWNRPHREMKYAAIDLARGKREFITPASLPLYERLVREGAWWDLVDEVAAHLIGEVLLHHRKETSPLLDRFIADDDFWIRRTAIIAQVRHKEKTDARRLFRYALARAHEKEFFIRKAIGWALRDYSRTNPDAVRRFLDEHGDKLSGLSRREASRHL